MADVQITVRGTAESTHAPERATVRLGVAIEGATRDSVFGGVTSSASSISAQITPLVDEQTGPVTWWASDQIRTWTHRPWNESGRQLPQVHHAAVDFEVRFSDFRALGQWISSVVGLSGVGVSGIEWSLTDSRRAQLTELSRAAAVRDAVDKASSYAHSLGLGEVRPVAIADLGMLDDPQSSSYGRGPSRGFALTASAASAGEMEQMVDFTPQDITITSSVDARFVA